MRSLQVSALLALVMLFGAVRAAHAAQPQSDADVAQLPAKEMAKVLCGYADKERLLFEDASIVKAIGKVGCGEQVEVLGRTTELRPVQVRTSSGQVGYLLNDAIDGRKGPAADRRAAGAQTREADPTVFGIRLGEKFTVAECKRGRDKFLPYGAVFSPPSVCYQHEGVYVSAKPNELVNTEEVGISLPAKDTPLLAVGVPDIDYPIRAQVIDGNIEVMTILTEGLKVQDAALALVKDKYGEPSTLTEERKQNGLGAVFSFHSAEWFDFSNLTVVFEGTADRTDLGLIRIMTNKGMKYLIDQDEQNTQAAPKL